MGASPARVGAKKIPVTHVTHMTHGDPDRRMPTRCATESIARVMTHLTHQTHGSTPDTRDPFDPLTDLADLAGRDPFDPSTNRPGQRDVTTSHCATL